MVSDIPPLCVHNWTHCVLILVLMEYGLWHSKADCEDSSRSRVLILVLMEYGLWRVSALSTAEIPIVLILVLMEYGLWLAGAARTAASVTSLNPCSNGIWSLTAAFVIISYILEIVLILVLMEYGLWRHNSILRGARQNVLILVLMEYGLWP